MKEQRDKNPISRIFLIIYFFFIVFLFLFSYTQVDLGLTLTRASIFTDIQKGFQYIGYFNRPLSTILYLICIGGLFGCYLYLLKHSKSISKKTLWILILLTTSILAFSYNAFSYDLFNYIFDAKIVTHYGLNPYIHKALDFQGEPMLSFMHWTHRVYPYGPLWLGLTVPLSFLGSNIFIVTFFLFKIFIAGAFLLTVYFIQKVSEKLKNGDSSFPVILFAFSPFVLVESLVSSHNDIVMMALCMAGVYLLVSRKFALAILLIVLSAAVKYATAILLPLVVILWMASYRKISLEWGKVLPIFALSLLFTVGAATLQSGNFQPWYLLFVMPVLVLCSTERYVRVPILIITVGALLLYVPYLFLGNDSYSFTNLLPMITLVTAILSTVVGLVLYKFK